jgi:hypothetical protein
MTTAAISAHTNAHTKPFTRCTGDIVIRPAVSDCNDGPDGSSRGGTHSIITRLRFKLQGTQTSNLSLYMGNF